jgi:hypothetical protein
MEGPLPGEPGGVVSVTLRVYGIRHHGPGCARSLVEALEEYGPDALLLEGPAEAEPLLPLVLDDRMRPPVALVVYPPEEPRRALYYPLAVFSPEWQALRFALERGIPVRMMDLPARHQLASVDGDEAAPPVAAPEESAPEPEPESEPAAEDPVPDPRQDPLALLARAAGYTDSELWWEHQVERRYDAAGLFDAIREAMTSLRDEVAESRERDLLREAWMRRTIRAACRDGYRRIAVVCGAWHAPVLGEDAVEGRIPGIMAKHDNERTRNLPKTKVAATWIPWTYHRLTFQSGYGAGVRSPGWYEHLWRSPRYAAARWVATAARLLRDFDLDASSASVIEAALLADALAALRDLRAPGLAELNEAILTVLTHGEMAPLALIRDKLIVGQVLGEVPPSTPSVPLAEDLESLQKALRLKPSPDLKTIDLDLREPNGLGKSRLLHRLRLLGIPWGSPLTERYRERSTFHERWHLQWQPEFAVAVIAANVWGNTVEAASAAAAVQRGLETRELAHLTELLDLAILSDLGGAVDQLLDRVQEQAAVSADVRHLMDALLPLARAARYGDVRQTRPEHLLPVIHGLLERIFVGLPAACASLDDEAAARMLESMLSVQDSLNILNDPEPQAEWQGVLAQLMHSGVNGLIRGWSCRALLEKNALTRDELHTAARRALSPANNVNDAAAWVQGLLRGSGLLLIHQDGVWEALDAWLVDLNEATFVEMLPLIRRAFSDFQPAERRVMGEKVRRLRGAPVARAASDKPEVVLDRERADRVLPVLAHILGVPLDERE